MNSLSWLLYGAEVAGNAQGVAISFSIVTGLAATACLAGSAMVMAISPNDRDKQNSAWMMSQVRPLFVGCVILASAAAVLPSRNTIMLIAASEVGETVLASEQAQALGGEAGALASDSLRVLRKFINEQLEEPAAEAKP